MRKLDMGRIGTYLELGIDCSRFSSISSDRIQAGPKFSMAIILSLSSNITRVGQFLESASSRSKYGGEQNGWSGWSGLPAKIGEAL